MGSIAPLLCWQPPRIVLGDYCAQYTPSCLCAQCFLMRDSRETCPHLFFFPHFGKMICVAIFPSRSFCTQTYQCSALNAHASKGLSVHDPSSACTVPATLSLL